MRHPVLQGVSTKFTGSYYSTTVYYEPVNLVDTPCTLTDTYIDMYIFALIFRPVRLESDPGI